jgi:hypothetical protein
MSKPIAPTFDFIWNLVTEEAREKALLQHAFYVDPDDIAATDSSAQDTLKVAESALKVSMLNFFLL